MPKSGKRQVFCLQSPSALRSRPTDGYPSSSQLVSFTRWESAFLVTVGGHGTVHNSGQFLLLEQVGVCYLKSCYRVHCGLIESAGRNIRIPSQDVRTRLLNRTSGLRKSHVRIRANQPYCPDHKNENHSQHHGIFGNILTAIIRQQSCEGAPHKYPHALRKIVGCAERTDRRNCPWLA